MRHYAFKVGDLFIINYTSLIYFNEINSDETYIYLKFFVSLIFHNYKVPLKSNQKIKLHNSYMFLTYV